MKRVIDSKHPVRPLIACLAVFAVACAGADEADEAPTFTPPTSGLGGAPTSAPPGGGGVPASAPSGASGNGATGVNTEGNAGSIGLGSGGSSPGVGNGAAGSAAVNGGNGNAGGASGGNGPVGVAGSAMVGNAGNGSDPPPASGAPGRVGAELCPPGPFASPLPANVVVQSLASVGANNFFIFEGVVWTGNALYLSEIDSGNDNFSQIDRFTPPNTFERGVFTNTGSNGLALAADGSLLMAAHDVGGISRLTLPGGAITRGNQTRNGERFNSPNDLVIRGDGNVYFTDPDFQSPDGRIQGGTFVYRIAPPLGAGAISVVDQNVDNPNGITLSPDGNTLYVAANGVLREYSLDAAGVPTPLGNLVDGFGGPDGMTVDCAGNIYAVQNGSQTVNVFSPDGERLGVIGPNGFGGQGVTNVAFGGANRTTLFVTTFSQGQNGGLFSVELQVPGMPY
jgi:gluconolactonase